MSSIENLLKDKMGERSEKYPNLETRLKQITHSWEHNHIELEGHFYYLTFKDRNPTIDEFVQLMYDRIADFCLPERIKKEYMEKFLEKMDERHIYAMRDEACDLFIKAKEQQKKTGEPGELALFLLLELGLHAPQIASKMFLKTNVNMPVHGSDGVHARFNSSTGFLNLIWGESKLYQQLPKALDDICSSISNFINHEQDGSIPKERDIKIIKGHLSIEDEDLKRVLLKYFDPYESESNEIEEYFACFVGFNYYFLRNTERFTREEIVEKFEEKYLQRIKTACDLFKEKIENKGIRHLKFIFFLLPFKDVSEVRMKFYRKLKGGFDE